MRNIIRSITYTLENIGEIFSNIFKVIALIAIAIFFIVIFAISSLLGGIILYFVSKFLIFAFEVPYLSSWLDPEFFSESIDSIIWLIICCFLVGIVFLISFFGLPSKSSFLSSTSSHNCSMSSNSQHVDSGFYDGGGNWRSWNQTYQDGHGNLRNPGDSFIDGKGKLRNPGEP